MKIKEWLLKAFTTALFLGYSPVSPGTVGTLGGVALFLALGNVPLLHAAAALAIFFLGVKACSAAEKIFQAKDAQCIVIDEVAGYLIAVLGFSPRAWPVLILGFVLFRLFDIFKPFPLRKLEKLPGGWGVMLDDAVAGVYANVTLHIILAIF